MLAFLLPEDLRETKQVFKSLPVKNQLDIVLRARGKEHLHYLFLSEDPEELIHRLPELEIFSTVKKKGSNLKPSNWVS
jgi:hypothetical protein